MNAVKEDVIKLVDKELKAANEKFRLFASDHEGYAVIKEEIEEAEECLYNVGVAIKEIWSDVKSNFDVDYDIEALKSEAINGAIELIQVAAMAQKFIDSATDREVKVLNNTKNPYKKIQEYIYKCGYTWSVRELICDYKYKYLKGYYVSHTCLDCIENCKDELEQISKEVAYE